MSGCSKGASPIVVAGAKSAEVATGSWRKRWTSENLSSKETGLPAKPLDYDE